MDPQGRVFGVEARHARRLPLAAGLLGHPAVTQTQTPFPFPLFGVRSHANHSGSISGSSQDHHVPTMARERTRATVALNRAKVCLA